MATNTFDPHGDDDLTPAEAATAASAADGQLASNVIRDKLAQIYAEEPSATDELVEAAQVSQRSQHQTFMYDLSTSGKDLATIQTEWHAYYQSLPDHEKQVVWQEFYASQAAVTGPAQPAVTITNPAQTLAKSKNRTATVNRSPAQKKKAARRLRDARSAREVQAAIRDTVSAGGKLDTKHHIQSLLFGLGMGAIVVVIFLFGFFNEVIIAPFIQPSRVSAATPLIINSNSVAPTPTPEVIIPKINVEIPINYDQTTTNEASIETALESGVVHYPTTVKPGQTGNAAFFGHSSNNIFNKGKYKFAFVLLHTLEQGDTFYLTYANKVYVYKVISKKVVEPSEVGVLGPVPGQTATATLITCDPPGTSLHRLVVVGQQISPDPSANTASDVVAPAANAAKSVSLPGNGPTLWGRLISTGVGKAAVIIIVLTIFLYGFRQLNKKLL